MHRLKHVSNTLESLKRQSLYRILREGRVDGSHITIDNHRMVNLGSNDYLGIQGTIPPGPHPASSRLVAGNDMIHHALEDVLSAHRGAESALVYPTGYMAVLGAIPTLAVPGCTILSDEKNHASIIDACRLAGGRTVVFEHNNIEHLESLLADIHNDAIIITEGIFSMDGDYADLQAISEVASRHEAAIVLDDAHGDFVAGPNGKGTAEMLGVSNTIYATISSLSKALGAFGGYVAGDRATTELQVNRARSFVYTSALPPAMALDAIHRAGSDLEGRRHILHANTRRIYDGLDCMGLNPQSPTHIIPVIIGGEEETLKFSSMLTKNGVYAPAIRYPTVPRGEARIRISVTASLSADDIDTILYAFEDAARHILS